MPHLMFTFFYIFFTKSLHFRLHFLMKIIDICTQNRGQEICKTALIIVARMYRKCKKCKKCKKISKVNFFCMIFKGDHRAIKGRSWGDQQAILKNARFKISWPLRGGQHILLWAFYNRSASFLKRSSCFPLQYSWKNAIFHLGFNVFCVEHDAFKYYEKFM